MPWDKPFRTTISFAVNDSAKKTSTGFKTEVKKFPLVYYSVVETPTNAAASFTVGWEYSVDGENWETLFSVASQNSGDSAIVDLSTVANKPDGAPYLRLFATPSQAIGPGQSSDVVTDYSWWIDEGQTGVKGL